MIDCLRIYCLLPKVPIFAQLFVVPLNLFTAC